MRFLFKSRRFRLLPLTLGVACATRAVAAPIGENEDVENLYNRGLHQALVKRQAPDLQDLAGRFLRDQEIYLRALPPDPEFILFQPGETIPILDLKAFPASFIDSLAGEIGTDGVVRFPVWMYEDADSPGREIIIESLEQKVIARIGRDRDYSPEWFARALYPALDTYAEWRRDWLTACYDPARVCMRYDLLVGKDNLTRYVWARSIETARLAEEREAAAMIRSGEGGSVSNLQFTAIGLTTNGTIELTLAWPDEGLSTNVVDIFACTDLCAKDWILADTLTLDMQTHRVVWVDPESANHETRFYDAWTHHDSDGDGIPDGREVRLYGTDPYNGDTDGDGLSDLAELFVHGTSALNADSDSDGIPDGWEVQYGLDPLDATGANGANGDPDGDGFTNLQEFQMGGNPANPAINATQLIHRLMHCRSGSSLRVDIEGSENCGGTNPNHQEVEDVFNVGPLMHCGYLLSLTVKGRVEDHNSGYDKVSIRAYTATELQSEVPFFEGHNNDNDCAMVNEQATTNVWFWSNGSVRLRYDTVDELYHTDAYAEITEAAFVDVLSVDLDIWNGGSDLDNGEAAGSQGAQVPDDDEESVGAYLLVNWDDDDGDGEINAAGSGWTSLPKPDLDESTSITDEDNLAQLNPNLTPLLDIGTVELEVSGADAGKIKLWTTSTKGTEVALTSNKKTWDLSNSTQKSEFQNFMANSLWIEGIDEGSAERALTFTLRYKDSGGTEICNDVNKATVVMLNLANAVGREVDNDALAERGHTSIVGRYDGTCTKADFVNAAQYTLYEADGGGDWAGTEPGPREALLTHVTARPGREFFGSLSPFLTSYYNSSSMPNTVAGYRTRLKILLVARRLIDNTASIGYTKFNAVLPGSWNGNLGTITDTRCDGFVEVCYEWSGVSSWGRIVGGGAQYSILVAGNQDDHNEWVWGDDPQDGASDFWAWLMPITQIGYADTYVDSHYPPYTSGDFDYTANNFEGTFWESAFSSQQLVKPTLSTP